jgi:ribosomal protein L32
MAVPKKKISYSKTRKNILSKKNKLSLYVKCDSCENFIKLHRMCFHCFPKGLLILNTHNYFTKNFNSKTNIKNLYNTNN